MSLNDFENVDEPYFIDVNPEIVSIMGKATANALLAKEKLQNATSEALDASFNFGYELGIMNEHERVLKHFTELGTDFGDQVAGYLIANPREEKN
jgi:hypothetical protein